MVCEKERESNDWLELLEVAVAAVMALELSVCLSIGRRSCLDTFSIVLTGQKLHPRSSMLTTYRDFESNKD